MKLKIDKEFEVDVDRIRKLSINNNKITIETSYSRFEITDTSQEISDASQEVTENPSDRIYESLRSLLDKGLRFIFMTSQDKKIIATVNKPIRKDGGWLYDATAKDLQITNEVIPAIDSHATLIDIEQWIKWREELM